MTPDERATLCSYGEFIDHHKGDHLVEQGLPQSYLHLLVDGELRVVLRSEEAVVPLAYVQPGESVGEMSLLEPVDASASVLANANSRTWCMSRDQFDHFTTEHPVAANKLLKSIAIQVARRLRKGSERLLAAEEE
jgi:CRP-like cAMP-binding protein